jgi:hypothetical protein
LMTRVPRRRCASRTIDDFIKENLPSHGWLIEIYMSCI